MRHALHRLLKVLRWGRTRVLFVVLMVGAALSAAGGGYLAARSATRFGSAAADKKSAHTSEGRFKKHEYVSFGTAVVNLAEGRLTRYLKVSIVLEVGKKDAKKVKEIVKGNTKAVLKHWLISYLSDLKLDDVKGSQSLSRIRTRVKEGFNRLLREHRSVSVEKVLFKEFSVQ